MFQASTLLETTCADLVESSTKNPVGSTTPIELLNLVKKTFLFRIEVNNTSNSKFEPSYRVKKICADPDLINQFKEAVLSLNDDSSPLLLLETPTSDESVTNTSSCLAKDLNEDFVAVSNDEVDAQVTNNAVDLKLRVEEVISCKRGTQSDHEGVGSTNNKKTIKKIKKEKN
ncbi:hypothetical protein OROGR_031410 [Orobanche gracilis]